MSTKTLACGHLPSTHGEHTTGTGYDSAGVERCWECCNALERESLKVVQHYTAYLVRELQELRLMTWPGGLLARVTKYRQTRSGFGRERWYFRAVDVHGAEWYGNSPGLGMYARMHRVKSSREGPES